MKFATYMALIGLTAGQEACDSKTKCEQKDTCCVAYVTHDISTAKGFDGMDQAAKEKLNTDMDLIKKNMEEGKSQCRPRGSESFETKEGVQFTYRCPEKKVQRQLKGVDFAEEKYGGLEACTLGGDPCSEEGFCCALWKKELYGTTGFDLTTIANDAYTNASSTIQKVYLSMFEGNYLTFMSSQGHSFCRDSSKESYTTPKKPTGATIYYMCDDTPKGKTPLQVQNEKKAEAKKEISSFKEGDCQPQSGDDIKGCDWEAKHMIFYKQTDCGGKQEHLYQGCFADLAQRDLPKLLGQNKEPDWCFEEAKKLGFNFVGLQNGNECWGGNSPGSYGKKDEKQCSKICGKLKHQCGGLWRNSVYKIN